MQRKIIKTADGSTTIQLPEWNEQYHSMHGAVQEARHVFLKMGLDHFLEKTSTSKNSLNILEIGFGTGLNAFLTCIEVAKNDTTIYYNGVEAYPVSAEEVVQLNYPELVNNAEFTDVFKQMHNSPWEKEIQLTPNFFLTKREQKFETIQDIDNYNLVYFDAFGAQVQPELWGEDIFQRMHNALKKEGVLVTYAAKGSVRRAMQSVGFTVERLPGPPGKREMLRATK
ncbi:MAG: tRNA (5-methylaminomethyl-2-thiouridine)(34)-methyltransferase MnmD [Leeuwenhoekiella sp.]